MNYTDFRVCFREEVTESLNELVARLWDMDDNKCEPGVDYDIDLQGTHFKHFN